MDLKEMFLSVALNGSRAFLPHLVASHQEGREYDLMINSNMLTLIDARNVVGQYKGLFRAILKKRYANALTIKMSVILPSLVGALGAVAEEVAVRSYNHLMIRLGGAFT